MDSPANTPSHATTTNPTPPQTPRSSALCVAAQQGDFVAIINMFSENPDVNVNAVNNRDEKNTPLHLAILGGHVEVVRYLLSRPTINLSVPNDDLKTPAVLANEMYNKKAPKSNEILSLIIEKQNSLTQENTLPSRSRPCSPRRAHRALYSPSTTPTASTPSSSPSTSVSPRTRDLNIPFTNSPKRSVTLGRLCLDERANSNPVTFTPPSHSNNSLPPSLQPERKRNSLDLS